MWSCTGRPVELFDTSPEQAQSALKFIKENIDTQLERTGCERRGKVTASSDLAEAVQDSWMVIEAVPEILDVKIQMMAQLDKMARPDCILATNSSPFRSSNMLENVKVQSVVLLKCLIRQTDELLGIGFSIPTTTCLQAMPVWSS
jgi:3-hydroxyacyl-CoA dehydrogenase